MLNCMTTLQRHLVQHAGDKEEWVCGTYVASIFPSWYSLIDQCLTPSGHIRVPMAWLFIRQVRRQGKPREAPSQTWHNAAALWVCG